VHELQGSDSHFIGLITLRSLTDEEIKHPPYNTHASTATCLSLVLGYSYLPTSWGHGYATESVDAVLKACGDAPKTFWEPFEQVVVRAVVNDENGPSQRVMEKSGMEGPEVLEFEGGTFFIAGKWRTKHRLFVYKRVVVG
jgi:RimJ/RimL family protein N-acetyltransferase